MKRFSAKQKHEVALLQINGRKLISTAFGDRRRGFFQERVKTNMKLKRWAYSGV